MEQNFFQREKKRLLLSALAVFLLALCAVVFFFIQSRRNTMPSVPVQTTPALQIARLEKKLTSETDPRTQASLQRSIALLFIQQDKLVKGFSVFRDIAENETYPKEARAEAVQIMGDIFLNRTDRSTITARTVVFSGSDRFRSMVNAENLDGLELRKGIFNLYSYALELAPLPVAEYRVAEYYAQQALPLSPSPTKTELLKKAVAHWEAGNTLSTGTSSEDTFRGGYVWRLRASVAVDLARLARDKKYVADARSSFARSRELLRAGANENEKRAHAVELLWTDLAYAQFLVAQGEKEKSVISPILGEIVQNLSVGENGFVKQIEFLGSSSAPFLSKSRANMMSLVGYNIDFDKFLRRSGFLID